MLLRGNHESRNMTENFTFREEVIQRYDEHTYNVFMECFDSMPVSCIVDNKYFGMHGGISPELSKVRLLSPAADSQIDRLDQQIQ